MKNALKKMQQIIGADKPFGVYASLPIQALGVDERYQRPLDEKRCERVQKAFMSGAVKALSVAKRDDGTYWIYDGQHTKNILSSMGHSEAHCIVVPSSGWREEARWFLLMNSSGVAKANVRDRHIAELAAEDAIALEAQAILSQHGISMTKGGAQPRTTSAIGAIKQYLKSDKKRLIEAMGMIKRLWADESHAWTAIMLRGAWEVAGDGRLSQVESGLKKHKIKPRRILDVAAGMQASTGTAGGGSAYIKQAYLQLAKVK